MVRGVKSIFEAGIQKCHIKVYSRTETSQLHYLNKPSELSGQNVLVILSSSQPAMLQLSQVNPAIIKIPQLTAMMKHNRNINALQTF